jgi:putative hemolysin
MATLSRKRFRHVPPRRLFPDDSLIALAPAVPLEALALEIASLPRERMACASGPFEVYVARAHEIPLALLEIGRLREESFRLVGEGTGRERDLDRFDSSYLHLFVWNLEAREIVGAYRLAATDEIEEPDAELYTHGLFDVDPRFHARLGPALELGRSFVAPAYQRSYAPLMLLWKGIGALVLARPRYRQLFGALTISAAYNPVSRGLMLDFLGRHSAEASWRELVRARRPVAQAKLARSSQDDPDPSLDVEALAAAVERSEEGRRRLPVLIRQYIRLGARVFDFSVDPDFGGAIDAFVLLDLERAPREMLDRYLGKQGAVRYLSCEESSLPREPSAAAWR